MPIEIKELHIKAVVVAEQQHTAPPMASASITKLKREITDEVLRKVLQRLKQKNER
ncbi:DUF5908 family protein [Parapedobacter sp. 2B3]|uniref:DUF5908 family protein n=1 Tax=Parapedobacter sp. 2B3 TaxID=3342381 RepID=UPI0035B57090